MDGVLSIPKVLVASLHEFIIPEKQISWHLKNYSLIPRLSPLQTILGGLGMRIQRHLHWIACFSTVSALVVWTSRLPSDSSSGSFSFSQRIYRFDSQTRYANNVRTGLRCAHKRPAATELETGIKSYKWTSTRIDPWRAPPVPAGWAAAICAIALTSYMYISPIAVLSLIPE